MNIGYAQSMYIDALIVDGQLLGFDLLGINAIRELGGLYLAWSGEVYFPVGDMF